METIIIVTIAFILGWKLNELLMAASFKKILEELKVSDSALRDLAQRNGIVVPEEDAAEKPKGTEVELKIEEIQGKFFAYESAKDTFVAQGDDPDQLLTRIIDRFPAGTRITVLKEHGGEIIEQAAARLRASS
jgi:hypothetical protein